MMRVRGGSGLGDALYVRPVAEHFVRQGNAVTVMSDYADVFIGSGARVDKFTRNDCMIVAHYTAGKGNPDTTQWDDVCANARVGTLPLSFAWKVQNQALIDHLKYLAGGRPIIMVNGGRHPMGRADGYAREMLPAQQAFETVLGSMQGCLTVAVGKGDKLYPLQADVDLTGRTEVADLLDIASICAGLIGQCSFMIPLAECFDKPLLVVWASRGLVSETLYIRQCTPQKILSKRSSRFVMDDWQAGDIIDAANLWKIGAARWQSPAAQCLI